MMLLPLLAQLNPTAVPVGPAQTLNTWALLGILFCIGIAFAGGTVLLSSVVGPRRKGLVKDNPYESGVEPVGDTKQRFNVRFYLVAMIFLVFDVDVLFLIPWITIFKHIKNPAWHSYTLPTVAVLFGSVLTFIVILLIAYFYALGKDVFKWD